MKKVVIAGMLIGGLLFGGEKKPKETTISVTGGSEKKLKIAYPQPTEMTYDVTPEKAFAAMTRAVVMAGGARAEIKQAVKDACLLQFEYKWDEFTVLLGTFSCQSQSADSTTIKLKLAQRNARINLYPAPRVSGTSFDTDLGREKEIIPYAIWGGLKRILEETRD